MTPADYSSVLMFACYAAIAVVGWLAFILGTVLIVKWAEK